jgi:hypothetical protein
MLNFSRCDRTQKYYLIFHELSHDVLNLDDLESNAPNENSIMYPSINAYKTLSMDDFIENFHLLIENYKDTSVSKNIPELSQYKNNISEQSQMLNGINLSGPEGFLKTGDLEWSDENNLINVQSLKTELSNEILDLQCEKGTRTTKFINSELIEISGKEYLICLQLGDNGLIIGQTVVYREGYSYILTIATNPKEDDSFSANEKAYERIGYNLGYMITRVNYY